MPLVFPHLAGPCVAVVLAASLAGCGGGSRAGRAHDLAEGGTLGAELGDAELFGTESTLDCAVEVLADSTITDQGLVTLADGDPKTGVSTDDGRELTAISASLRACG